MAETGADGRTPGRHGEGALLLTDRTWRATDTPNQPEERAYAYDLTVEADGFAGAYVKGVQVSKSWQVVRVTLTKPM